MALTNEQMETLWRIANPAVDLDLSDIRHVAQALLEMIHEQADEDTLRLERNERR